MADSKNISIRKFNEQVRLVEISSKEIAVLQDKLTKLRSRYKKINATNKALKEQADIASQIANKKIQEMEATVDELQKISQEKDRISASTIDDLRTVVDQQKREIERLGIPAQAKSLIPSSAKRVAEAPRRNYAPLVPGGKAGA